MEEIVLRFPVIYILSEPQLGTPMLLYGILT